MNARARNSGSRREGASQSKTRLSDVLRSWIQHHRASALDSLGRLLGSPFSSLMTWLVIGVAMALPVGLSVALDNARSVSTNWDSPAQISLFLRAEMSEEAALRLQESLDARNDVGNTLFVGREEALHEFQELSGFGDVLRNLDDNPLPNLIIVSPAVEQLDADAAQALQQSLATLSGVDRAVLDMEWVQRLNSLMALSQRLVMALGLILGSWPWVCCW
jgi:cell division transport system permease protein